MKTSSSVSFAFSKIPGETDSRGPATFRVILSETALGDAPLGHPSAERDAIRHGGDQAGAVHAGLSAADNLPGPLVLAH